MPKCQLLDTDFVLYYFCWDLKNIRQKQTSKRGKDGSGT